MKMQEYTEIAEPKFDDGVLRDVVILGQKSKNGRVYSEQAMIEAVLNKVYEDKPVYLNHERGTSRKVEDRIGTISNVYYAQEEKKIRGNFTFLCSHPAVAQIKEDFERNTNMFGFSHDIMGKLEKVDGVNTITEIREVISIDIVSNSATTVSLKEEVETPLVVEPTLREKLFNICADETLSDEECLAQIISLLPVEEKCKESEVIEVKVEESVTPPPASTPKWFINNRLCEVSEEKVVELTEAQKIRKLLVY